MFTSQTNLMTNLADRFLKPSSPAHHRYEALRTRFVEGYSLAQAAPGRIPSDARPEMSHSNTLLGFHASTAGRGRTAKRWRTS